MPNLKICVHSCNNLKPSAYVYKDKEDLDKLKCKRECPSAAPYIDNNSSSITQLHPTCVEICPENLYLDELTMPNRKICVDSCKNLIP